MESIIHVSASCAYDVLISSGCLSKIQLPADTEKIALVSDDCVAPLYAASVEDVLSVPVARFILPHGEAQKNLTWYGKLLNFLCEQHLGRKDIIIALGGGVVGDLAGFAAATYLRGIRYIQIPTTLLAMVDSSVGGKTAIDLDGGKNQAGCFYQPFEVLCDPNVLRTLPQEQYACGWAEVIKYAILGNAALFHALQENSWDMESIIAACVRMKRDFVQEDEFDFGNRQLLNLGHTIGHAIEAVSRFSVLHGQAVAIGMATMVRASANMGIFPRENVCMVENLLRQYNLPTQTDYSADMLCRAAIADKKRIGDTFRLIVPEDIGRCSIRTIPVKALRDWLLAGGIA